MNKLNESHPISSEMGIDDGEVAIRKAFLEFAEEDAVLLKELHVRLEGRRDAFSVAFYNLLQRFPETARLLGDGEKLERLKRVQTVYFSQLTEGEYGAGYVENRLHVGVIHQRIGVSPRWYVGAYRKYLDELMPLIFKLLDGDTEKCFATYSALLKIIFFDMELTLDTYFHTEHQQRIATLSRMNEEIRLANQQVEQAQSNLLQSEKMASIGQLAAGVAHEINNPIGFVYSNLGTLEKYVQDTFGLLDLYEQAEGLIADAEMLAKLKAAKDKLDIAFIKVDLQALMGESKDGITRVKKIVQSLKDFSHVDAVDEWHFSDLHNGIDSTLNIVNNEIRYKANVVKEYGELPEVESLSSQLNQVFMNLLVNASHAIEERGTITIRTGQQGDEVWVEVADTGKGIAPEHIKKIFDPFFTTKPIGKGTGLGLSLSYGILQKHHGRIEVQSEIGKGTTFRIWLPVKQLKATQW